MVSSGYRQRISSNLIGGITISGNAVSTHDDPLNTPRLHEKRGRGIRDQSRWNPILIQLPNREASALRPRTSLGGIDRLSPF